MSVYIPGLLNHWPECQKIITSQKNTQILQRYVYILGLFIADQDVNQDRATHTRQNNNGNRNGYECPEERDHFPYWHPTQWKDVMVFTKNESRCKYYQTESFNVKPKGKGNQC